MFTPETIPPFSVENYRQYVDIDKPLLRLVWVDGEEYPLRLLALSLTGIDGRTIVGVFKGRAGLDDLLFCFSDGTVDGSGRRIEFRPVLQEKPFTLDDYNLLVLKEKSYELVIQQLDNSVPDSLNYQYPATIYRTDLLSSLHPILGSFHRGDFETHFRAGTDGIGHGDPELWSKPFQLHLVPRKP